MLNLVLEQKQCLKTIQQAPFKTCMKSLKKDKLHSKITRLNANEVLIALTIGAVTNPTAQLAVDKLTELKDVQAHSTVMLSKDDEQILKKLGIDVTCDPVYPSDNLYYM